MEVKGDLDLIKEDLAGFLTEFGGNEKPGESEWISFRCSSVCLHQRAVVVLVFRLAGRFTVLAT